ncbi:MAG: hypothetical protein HYS08_01395 [Chlamydiae bacterium]|nr:hypothetical protein [Chlamydiota bacterium]MBI3265636.1 hypothetical protein [Chlamydiota bacterium]
MSAKDYILKEVELMKEECRRLGIKPEEWIARFAVQYHQTFSQQVLKLMSSEYK